MFIDEARIQLKAGDGGNGCVSFRREKHVPHGGPDGGDGGSGGSVIFVAKDGPTTLSDYHFKSHFKADRGLHGKGKKQHGKRGADVMLDVPLGTLIKDDAGKVLGDLVAAGDSVRAVGGGRGGRGNARFVSSRRQAPGFAEKGERGEERWLRLELKLLADVGIVGYPNAGKSTLISKISGAKPKIADYPFTTKAPNLGVVRVADDSFVVADIPGLIEGAHAGHGLGDLFLRHIERTACLVHVLDLSGLEGRDPLADYRLVRRELALFDPALLDRPHLVAGNKTDLPTAKKNAAEAARFFRSEGIPFFEISALTGSGLDRLLYATAEELRGVRAEQAKGPQKKRVVYRLADDDQRVFSVTRQGGSFRVEGKGVERLVAMTDQENDEAVAYLQRRLQRLGLERELEKKGASAGDTILIGASSFEFQPESAAASEGSEK